MITDIDHFGLKMTELAFLKIQKNLDANSIWGITLEKKNHPELNLKLTFDFTKKIKIG